MRHNHQLGKHEVALDFNRGDCAVLALRIAELTNLPLIGLFDQRGDLHHVAVEVDRDHVLDAATVNTKHERAEAFVPNGVWRRVTITNIVAQGLPDWDGYDEAELDYVDQVAEEVAQNVAAFRPQGYPLGAWTDANWRREDAAGLLEYAEEEGMGFQSDHPLDSLKWRYEHAYPIKRLTQLALIGGPGVGRRRAWSANGWRTWYANEGRLAAEDGRDGYWDGMEHAWQEDPIGVGPVIIVENPKGWFDIGDGWHRIGASFKLGLTHIPAVVGTYPR
jgi:hypothetical protein